MTDRKLIGELFVRVSKDAGFKLEATMVAQIVAGVLNIHPMDVMGALTWSNMQTLADGTHPSLQET